MLFLKKFINKLEEFSIYLKYCRMLKFEERPDYCWLKRLFKDLFFKVEKDWDLIFDWTKIVIFIFNFVFFFKFQKKLKEKRFSISNKPKIEKVKETKEEEKNENGINEDFDKIDFKISTNATKKENLIKTRLKNKN